MLGQKMCVRDGGGLGFGVWGFMLGGSVSMQTAETVHGCAVRSRKGFCSRAVLLKSGSLLACLGALACMRYASNRHVTGVSWCLRVCVLCLRFNTHACLCRVHLCVYVCMCVCVCVHQMSKAADQLDAQVLKASERIDDTLDGISRRLSSAMSKSKRDVCIPNKTLNPKP